MRPARASDPWRLWLCKYCKQHLKPTEIPGEVNCKCTHQGWELSYLLEWIDDRVSMYFRFEDEPPVVLVWMQDPVTKYRHASLVPLMESLGLERVIK